MFLFVFFSVVVAVPFVEGTALFTSVKFFAFYLLWRFSKQFSFHVLNVMLNYHKYSEFSHFSLTPIGETEIDEATYRMLQAGDICFVS